MAKYGRWYFSKIKVVPIGLEYERLFCYNKIADGDYFYFDNFYARRNV